MGEVSHAQRLDIDKYDAHRCAFLCLVSLKYRSFAKFWRASSQHEEFGDLLHSGMSRVSCWNGRLEMAEDCSIALLGVRARSGQQRRTFKRHMSSGGAICAE